MDKTFEEWLKELDVIFAWEIGFSHSDVEDYDWYSEWECENTPRDAFDEWNLQAGPKSGEL